MPKKRAVCSLRELDEKNRRRHARNFNRGLWDLMIAEGQIPEYSYDSETTQEDEASYPDYSCHDFDTTEITFPDISREPPASWVSTQPEICVCPDEGDPYVAHCPAHCPALKDPSKRVCGGVECGSSCNLDTCPDAGNPNVVHCPALCPSLRAAANMSAPCGPSRAGTPSNVCADGSVGDQVTPGDCRAGGLARRNLFGKLCGAGAGPSIHSGGFGGGKTPKLQVQDEMGRITPFRTGVQTIQSPCAQESQTTIPCPSQAQVSVSPCPGQGRTSLSPRQAQIGTQVTPPCLAQASTQVTPCPGRNAGTPVRTFDCTAVIHIEMPNQFGGNECENSGYDYQADFNLVIDADRNEMFIT